MFFNKYIFIFLSCIFISSCGLQIGEVAPKEPGYYLSSSSGICSQLGDYKEVFLDYFFKDGRFGEKLSQALACISFKLKEMQSLIKHDQLNKQQTVNILNQDFIQKSYMNKVIDHILNPDYFYNYVSIKNNLVHLIQPDFKRAYLRADWICQINPNDDNIISKKSVDILLGFLGDLSELFSSVERDAYIIFEEFFTGRSISKSEFRTSQQALLEFSSFLSDYLVDRFPSYSEFLKNIIELEKVQAPSKVKEYKEELDHMKEEKEEEDKTPLKEAMAPLLSSFDLRFFNGNKIQPQNLKYMMLNIYIMQAFFKAYDLNKDFILSSQELQSLSCLMTPLVSIVVSSELKEEWEIIQTAYDPRVISNYIINYKRLPPIEKSFRAFLDSNTWRFLMFRMTRPDELHSQSYTEISELISLLFLEFFNKIQFEKS